MPPKAMLKISGKTLLERQCEWLREQGFENVVLALGHRENEVVTPNLQGLNIIRVIEKESLGTAGAIKNAWKNSRNEFNIKDDEWVYVMNVDDVISNPYDARDAYNMALTTSNGMPVVIGQKLPFSHINPQGGYCKQNLCYTHVGHHFFKYEHFLEMPDKGDMPGWLELRRVVVYALPSNSSWLTVNDFLQLCEMRRKIK